MDKNPPPEVFVTDAARVFCDGDERGGDGHPRVWLQIGSDGFADCGYCDRRFILAGGSADKR
jgi:NADH dehydrogenase (ubiquinone) Fe-S protein 6